MHFKTNEVDKIAIIGDRIMADTVMGNTHGFFTIYVEPFDIRNENFMVKLMRKIEGKILPLITPEKPPRH